MKKYITRNIVLNEIEDQIVRDVVEERSLGGKGHSAAIRMIIREWNVLTNGGRFAPVELMNVSRGGRER